MKWSLAGRGVLACSERNTCSTVIDQVDHDAIINDVLPVQSCGNRLVGNI